MASSPREDYPAKRLSPLSLRVACSRALPQRLPPSLVERCQQHSNVVGKSRVAIPAVGSLRELLRVLLGPLSQAVWPSGVRQDGVEHHLVEQVGLFE